MSDGNDENWRERRLQQQQSAAGAAGASYELALTGLAVCGTAPRSSAAVYRRRLPARATTVYNNTKATELTQAGNGGVRRATFVAPANREEPSYSYFAGCQPIKSDLKFSWPCIIAKKIKSIILQSMYSLQLPSLH